MAKRIKRNPSHALIYIRVSSEKQAVSGLGLEDQEKRCKTYCEMMGLEILGIFKDEVVTAGKPLERRPAGKQLLDTLRKTGASAVVTLKLDRAFRSAVDALLTVEKWERSGISFHMVDFGGATINTSTPAGKMFLTMMAGFAEFERGLISERTKAALSIKKENGELTGTAPYGQRVAEDGVHLEDDLMEQIILKKMVELRELGFTYRDIPKILTRDGYKNREGNEFNHCSVRQILMRVMGEGAEVDRRAATRRVA